MPRKAKTQPVQTAASQAYGVAGEQKQAMTAMPLPDSRAPAPASKGTGASPGAGVVAPSPAPGTPNVLDPMQVAMGTARQIPKPPAILGAPSQNEAQPVTAGLPMGAGPGPEALGVQPIRTDPVVEVLEAAAVLTGAPQLMEAARRRRRG